MREDILETKLDKLEKIRSGGMEAYPEKCERTLNNAEALEKFDELSASEQEIYLVGRVKSNRPMGNACFTHIEDGFGKMQLFLSKQNVGDEKYKLFVKNVENGDFIQAKGKLFLTKQDEKSLQVSEWKMLSKNIRPIPTEY